MKKRFLSAVLVLTMLCTMLPTVALARETENDSLYDINCSATISHDKEGGELTGRATARVEYYMVDRSDTAREVKPCDIIFLLEQSKWMNSTTDNGAEREAILFSITELLEALEPPTAYGEEHRVAIAGYGRINNGSDPYAADMYPGQKFQKNPSLNTGYYTKFNKQGDYFHSDGGWTEYSNVPVGPGETQEEKLPLLPSTCLGGGQQPSDIALSALYDDVFMSIADAKAVVQPENMAAWYSQATRMDAGLALVERLAEIANAHKGASGDRNLIVCIAASSIPTQEYAGKKWLRDKAAIAASETLKEEGAIIFAMGDYHLNGAMDDSKEKFKDTMLQICGAEDTSAEEKEAYFKELSEVHDLSTALTDLITKITETAAGSDAVPITISANEFTDVDDQKCYSWNDIKANHNILDYDIADVDYYAFIGYEDGVPQFEECATTHIEVPISELEVGDDISYGTKLVPIPPADVDVAAPIYGYKVVITITDPVEISYGWLGEDHPEVAPPQEEYVVRGGRHNAAQAPVTSEKYLFDGWYREKMDGDDGKESVTVGGTEYVKYGGMVFGEMDEDLELFGRWLAGVTVTYQWADSDIVPPGVDLPVEELLVSGSTHAAPSYPDREDGYQFAGWFQRDDDGALVAYTGSAALKNDITLYGRWEDENKGPEPTHTVTLAYSGNAAGAVNIPDDASVEVADGEFATFTVASETPECIGYTFTAWNTDADGEGDDYRPGAALTTVTNMILFAQWKRDSTGGSEGGGSTGGAKYYTLHYASNGGTEYPDERYAGNTVVDLKKAPSREGYVFIGWFADEALSGKITDIKMTSDKTVYAGWRPNNVPDMLNGDDHFAYVAGYTDGTVRPLSNITRAETATIFFRLLEDGVRNADLSYTNTFDDVSDELWCNIPISTMAKLGIVYGRTTNFFDPNAPITRGEFAAICARFDTGHTSGQSNFTDIDGHWAKADIEHAASLGWIRGYGDGTFRPDQYITRAEAMTMINRVLCRVPEDKDDLLDGMIVWPDNAPGDWYYLAVQEASNGHEYQHKGEIYERWTKLVSPQERKQYK